MSKTAGITLIELLLVIALVSILAVATTPFLTRFLTSSSHDTLVDTVVGSVQKAQNYAMVGKNNTTWGVCVTGGNLRLFAGSCNAPTYQENYSVNGAAGVSGLTSVTFNSRGEPSATQNIQVTSSVDTTSILVTAAGGIDVQ